MGKKPRWYVYTVELLPQAAHQFTKPVSLLELTVMQRRVFTQTLATTVGLGLSPLAWAQPAGAAPAPAASEFVRLDNPAPVETPPGKIEVVEFFWYACPHCNDFEPALEAWAKTLPKDVVLRRVPVAFRDSFVPHQKLFYTLEALGRVGDLHRKVFAAIHVQGERLDQEGAILAWAAQQGLDRAKFQEAYNSFAVNNKVRRARQLQDAFEVQGVPSLGIAGRYYTDGTLARSMPRVLQVTDALIAQARKKT